MSRVSRQNAEDAAAEAMAREVQALNEARVAFEAERSEHEQRATEDVELIRLQREVLARDHAAVTAATAALQIKVESAEQAQHAARVSSPPASAAAGSLSPTVSQDTIVVDILKAIKTFN